MSEKFSEFNANNIPMSFEINIPSVEINNIQYGTADLITDLLRKNIDEEKTALTEIARDLQKSLADLTVAAKKTPTSNDFVGKIFVANDLLEDIGTVEIEDQETLLGTIKLVNDAFSFKEENGDQWAEEMVKNQNSEDSHKENLSRASQVKILKKQVETIKKGLDKDQEIIKGKILVAGVEGSISVAREILNNIEGVIKEEEYAKEDGYHEHDKSRLAIAGGSTLFGRRFENRKRRPLK